MTNESQASLLDQLRIDRTAPGRPERPFRPRHRGWWAAGGALLAAAALAAWFRPHADRVPAHAAVQPAAQTSVAAPFVATPTPGSTLDASGYVVALREATVSAKNIYKVTEVLVQEGQAVQQGEVIARLDDANARATLAQSRALAKQNEASLNASRLAASDARPTFLRDQRQFAEGLISAGLFETSKSAFDAAAGAVAVAQENLAVARATVAIAAQYVDDTVIRAPFAGMVTVKSAHPGEIVSPQFSGGGGIAKIVDMDSLEVDVDVNENFINRVHPNQRAAITLNAYPDSRLPARVIAAVPTADRAKATVKVRIAFDQHDPRVVPEMGARVSFLEEGATTSGAAGAVGTTTSPATRLADDAAHADATR